MRLLSILRQRRRWRRQTPSRRLRSPDVPNNHAITSRPAVRLHEPHPPHVCVGVRREVMGANASCSVTIFADVDQPSTELHRHHHQRHYPPTVDRRPAIHRQWPLLHRRLPACLLVDPFQSVCSTSSHLVLLDPLADRVSIRSIGLAAGPIRMMGTDHPPPYIMKDRRSFGAFHLIAAGLVPAQAISTSHSQRPMKPFRHHRLLFMLCLLFRWGE